MKKKLLGARVEVVQINLWKIIDKMPKTQNIKTVEELLECFLFYKTPIRHVAKILGINYQTVFSWRKRLGHKLRERK